MNLTIAKLNLYTYTDQLHRKIELQAKPTRIVSLVPSQTELLHYIGLDNEVVGITKYCTHPKEWLRTKSLIGGTKKINFEIIDQLKPDLIIGNKEENEKAQIEKLMLNYPVWMSNIHTLNDALNMITDLGELVGKKAKAIQLKSEIETQFKILAQRTIPPKKVAYLIWRKPYMAAGKNTFINDMLTRIGLNNIFATSDRERYPEIDKETLQKQSPELVLLSSEPFPFKEKHISELKAILPNAQIILVDGEMFSWYGSRLLYSSNYFKGILQNTNRK